MIPVFVLCAEAGAGKDTLGAHLAEALGGVTVGFADPLKQMAAEFFGFTDHQLFGPSEARNEVDPRFTQAGISPLWEAQARVTGEPGMRWCRDLFPTAWQGAHEALKSWFQACADRAKIDNGLSARYVLQTLGTEWGRTLAEDVWVDRAYAVALKLLSGGHTYTRAGGLAVAKDQRPYAAAFITDGRFPNEALKTRARGGFAVQVLRPGKADTTTSGVVGHASEALLKTIPSHFFDATIVNDGTVEQFKDVGVRVVRELAFKTVTRAASKERR